MLANPPGVFIEMQSLRKSLNRCLKTGYLISLTCLAFPSLASPGAGDASQAVQLKTFLTHSRLLFKIDDSVQVSWKKTPTGFELLLKGITLNDLGAPMGEEARWKSLYKGIADTRVEGIEFQEKAEGILIHGKWKYPKGALTLANPEMEIFDYREKNPPGFVVDFWVKKGPTRIDAALELRRKQHLAALNKVREEAKSRIERRLATERKRAEAANSSRFCDRPMSEENDLFLEFLPVHVPYKFSKFLPMTSPDTQFHYFKPKSENKDAQYVRLALNLYGKGKFGLAVRTLDFLESEYPSSDYQLEMEFLRANLMIKLGHPAVGESILRKLIQQKKESPVALHSAMYLAGREMEIQSYQQALQTFFWLIQNYSNHDAAWMFHLGAAECLYSMHESDRAAKEFRWVIENAPTDDYKAEAAYRMGDIYQLRFQYEQSLAAYFQGIHYFPKQASRFPGFHVNRAEALYQLQQYDRAEQAFKEYLEKFPGHPEGWRATLRLAEIVGRRESISDASSVARKWNYETINHYPFSPGSTLARLRLLPCGDHGGFSLSKAEKFFEESKDFDGDGKVLMKNYQDFRAIAHIRTLITMGTQDQIALSAIHELQNTKGTFARVMLSTIANDFFQKMISRLLDENKNYEAISYYTSVAPIIPPAETVTDIDYLLKLSQAASDLGMGGFAKKLYENYDHQLHRNRKIASVATSSGSAAGGNASLVVDLDRFESEIRISERAFTEAKALWVNSKITGDTESFGKIRNLLETVRDESAYSFEKELILGLIDQREGKFESALKHVNLAESLNPSVRVQAWQGLLQKDHGDLRTALEVFRDLEKRMVLRGKTPSHQAEHSADAIDNPLALPEMPSLEEVLRAEAEILEKQNEWAGVVEVYQRALEYGLTQPSIHYSYARALEKMGTTAEVVLAGSELNTLSKWSPPPAVPATSAGTTPAAPAAPAPAGGTPGLTQTPESFWKRMASETLADARSMGTRLDAKEGTK
ncbi:MAG: tetratricopeptide repeat protein [Bdellovibrio sp.]|nr:tetratricopeptide repeat protein [Bdellovibrio sp.]